MSHGLHEVSRDDVGGLVVVNAHGHVAPAILMDEYQTQRLAAALKRVIHRARNGDTLSGADHVILMRAWKISNGIPEESVGLLRQITQVERRS